MPPLKSYTVKSLADFIKQTQSLLPESVGDDGDHLFESNWYRGIGNVNFKLHPGLFRHPLKKKISELLFLERVMVEDFKRQAIFHTEKPDDETEAAELRMLFIMQHHGIPTRLLDWSTNPLISLYFALSTAAQSNEGYESDAAVWVLNPYKWNEHALKEVKYGDIGPLTQNSAAARTYAPKKAVGREILAPSLMSLHDHPAAILGTSNSARMFAQRGVFTIFGKSVEPMETQAAKSGFPKDALRRIVISKKDIKEMLRSLIRLGFTDSVAYPDLQGIALEIKRLRGFGV